MENQNGRCVCLFVRVLALIRARGPGGLLLLSTSSILAHHQHPSIRSRTHPQHARTHDRRTGSVLLCTQCHTRRSRSPRASVLLVPPHAHSVSLYHAGPRTPFPLPAVVSPLAWRLSFLLKGSHPFLGRSFFLSTCIALRRAPRRPHARKFASPRTDDRRTNDAACGPQAWLTGRLHYGGIRSVRSPLRRPPPTRFPYRHALTMRPLQKVRPFSFLNY